MSDFVKTMKALLTRGAKGAARTACCVAKETKFKANEMSELGKKRELLSELGAKVYDLSQNGLVLPAEAAEIVQQLTALDRNLFSLRANHSAEKAAQAQQRAAEKAARAAEKAAAQTAAAIQMSIAPVEVGIPADKPAADTFDSEEAPACPALDIEAVSSEKPADSEIPTLNV